MTKNLQRSNKNKNILIGAKKAFALFALFLMTFLAVPSTTHATLQDDLNEVNEQINDAKDELSGIKAEKNTLQGQVNAFNKEISNIEYQISLTNRKISLLNTQITQTEKEIKQAELDLEKARLQLSEIIKAMYEDGQLSTLEVVAKSNSFSEYVNRSEYMEQMQVKVKENADKVVALKNQLETKKSQLESGKQEAVSLKSEQLGQRAEISASKSAKDNLLAITKGNEAEYLALVKNLQQERERIEAEIWSNSGGWVSMGKVEQGDLIGYQGNSGWSTGPHLHFEIRPTTRTFVNPMSYIGNGTWGHPIPGARITCVYGNSCYSGHTGTDFSRYLGAPIYASAAGEIVKRVTGRPNTYLSSYEYGNYVIIRHYNGWYTWYAHLQ